LNRLPRPPDCQATGKNGDGTALKRGKVSVDASRKSRSDDEAFEPELGGKLACEFLPTAEPLQAPTMATMGPAASSSLLLA
jgi:hypothetical protein